MFWPFRLREMRIPGRVLPVLVSLDWEDRSDPSSVNRFGQDDCQPLLRERKRIRAMPAEVPAEGPLAEMDLTTDT